MKGFLFVLREFIVCVALMTAGILAAALIADWYITEVRGHVYEAPATESGDTGYYSSPHGHSPGYDRRVRYVPSYREEKGRDLLCKSHGMSQGVVM